MMRMYSVCNSLYLEPVFPHSEGAEYLLIISALELALLLSLLIFLFRKKYYRLIEHNVKKAKSLLLPFYDRIVYWYSFITIIRMLFAILQYSIVSNHKHLHQMHDKWYMLLIESISDLGILSLEVFIAFLLCQQSVGKNAFNRARIHTFLLCFVQSILMLVGRNVFSENGTDLHMYSIFEVAIHSLMLTVYISIFFYVCIYHETYKSMKRERNKILYAYLCCIILIHLLLGSSFLLQLVNIDGFCFTNIGQYLYRVLFPIFAFFTIKFDSAFWKQLFKQIQVTSNTNLQTQRHKQTMQSIFGDMEESQPSFIDPLVCALELEINMIDYDELQLVADPFAMGSTAMVYKARWRKQDVAVKKWIFAEIDLSLEHITEFFRETFFSNIVHQNLVQFVGACLRPPELCLVYEYCCCGDLAHLLLTQYFRDHFQQKVQKLKQYSSAKTMKNRLQILCDIANGMAKLHNEGIIHRDLKTSNILVQYESDYKKYIAKVCDFGSARKIEKVCVTNVELSPVSNSSLIGDECEDEKRERMTTQVGTLLVAPELLSIIDINKLSGAWSKKKCNECEQKDEYQLFTDTMPNSLEMEDRNRKKGNMQQNRKESVKRNIISSLSSRFRKAAIDPHETNTFSVRIDRNCKKTESGNNSDIVTTIYDKTVDVFAFGAVMFEIGFLRRIYNELDIEMIYETVTNNKRNTQIPTYEECQNPNVSPRFGFYIIKEVVYDKYVALMNECWKQNPAERPSFHQIGKRLEEIEAVRKTKW